MNDTSEEFMAYYRARVDTRTDSQRLLRGLRMFDDGKALLRAGIRHDDPGLRDGEVEKRLFLRMYGNELSPDRSNARSGESTSALPARTPQLPDLDGDFVSLVH